MKHNSCSNGSGPCVYSGSPLHVIETGNEHSPVVEIWRCSVCGHGITLPAMKDVAPLYAGRESEDFLARDARWVEQLKRKLFRKLSRSLLRASPNPPVIIADFGTGNGMLAEALASEASTAAQVYALDFFDSPPKALEKVVYLPFSRSTSLAGKVDFLTCFHVLEHDDDPDAFLQRLTAYLRPGGILIAEVPNVDCVWNGWFGKNSANWYAPFHRVHFTRNSLSALFRRNGLVVISQEDICGPTFALSFAKVLGVRPNSMLFALAAAMRPLQWGLERMTRRPSALRIFAAMP